MKKLGLAVHSFAVGVDANSPGEITVSWYRNRSQSREVGPFHGIVAWYRILAPKR